MKTYRLYQDDYNAGSHLDQIRELGMGVYYVYHIKPHPIAVSEPMGAKDALNLLRKRVNTISPDGDTITVYFLSDGKKHRKPWKGKIMAEDGWSK